MFLDESTIRRHLSMADVIRVMERALADFSAGLVDQPVRTILPVSEYGAFLGLMPARTATALGVKLVTYYPDNIGLPTHHAVIQLFHPDTGEPLVTMDGRLITEMRTAAASAVATGRLARQDAHVLAILGSGVQARSHLEALRLVRRFDEVRVWSPRNADRFADAFGIDAVQSAEDAVRGAEVIVVATGARTPVLAGVWLSRGVHINAVGATRPDWRELDDDVLRHSRLYVDSRAAALAESGDVRAADSERIAGEIGEVMNGTAPGRESESEITLFKSLGIAVEDVATAEFVWQRVSSSL